MMFRKSVELKQKTVFGKEMHRDAQCSTAGNANNDSQRAKKLKKMYVIFCCYCYFSTVYFSSEMKGEKTMKTNKRGSVVFLKRTQRVHCAFGPMFIMSLFRECRPRGNYPIYALWLFSRQPIHSYAPAMRNAHRAIHLPHHLHMMGQRNNAMRKKNIQ